MGLISTSTSLERYSNSFLSLFISLSHMSCTAPPFTALHCTALHCTTLHSTTLHSTVLHCTALYCTALHSTVLHYATLPFTVLHCSTLHHTTPHHTTPHHTTLQIVTKGNDILVKVQTPDNMRTLDPTNPLRRNPQRDRDSDRERGRNSEVLNSMIDIMGFISSCV
jgi:hypothetical protein